MHIQFELGLQKLGSWARRKFLREEIDNFLNRAQDQFIQDSVKVKEDTLGFETIQVDIDRIRPIVAIKTINAEYKKTYKSYIEYNIGLPSDYSYLVSDRWYDAKTCSTNITTSSSRAIIPIPFEDSTAIAQPYYADFQIRMAGGMVDDVVIVLSDDTNSLWTGVTTIEQKFSIPRLVQELFQQKINSDDLGIGGSYLTSIYWEKYKNFYYPNNFVFIVTPVTPGVFTYTPALTLDTVEIDNDGGVEEDYIVHSTVDGLYSNHTSRLVRSSKLDNVLQTEYYKPQITSPVSAIDGDTLRLFSHTSRIVNSVDLTYIRQAQRINLTLQRNCELAPDFHQKIVDMAVQYATGRLEQKDLYQITTLENKQ
jgi:hypothetical protein